jgi:hypothetical protein
MLLALWERHKVLGALALALASWVAVMVIVWVGIRLVA